MGCESANSSSKKIIQSQTFFSFDTGQRDITNNKYQNYKTPVKLGFILEGCANYHKYQILVIMADNNNKFTTEILNANENFVKFNSCYICNYFFERQQYLYIKLLKNGIESGDIKVALGTIVGSPKNIYRTEIGKEKENIIVIAQSIKETDSFINFDFIVKAMETIDFQNINNLISFKISNPENLLYQSESISYLGKFQPIKIPIAILGQNFTVSFLNSEQKILGFKDETIGDFREQIKSDSSYLGFLVNDKIINIYNNSKIFSNYSFIDYLKSGVTIKLTIGIDFTSSNKPPNDPNSLHYLGREMNDYELAIRACGTVVAYYDYNQSFPVYGFGAIVKGEKKANMCFNVNFQQNPEVYTIDNVIKAYRNCFNNIILAGETEFCPLIKNVNEKIRQEQDPLKYHILMILTDGIIVDQQKTIDALVDGSFLPLSVIIIGIGNDHFKEMIELDGDENPITSSNGVKRKRDLVQFVPFNKYKNDPTELAAQVLEEVPRQIMEYYTMKDIYPDNISRFQKNKLMNYNNINQNINYNNFNAKYLNDSHINYKNFMNFNNNCSFTQTINNQNIQLSNSYHIAFDADKQSKGTGVGSIYY